MDREGTVARPDTAGLPAPSRSDPPQAIDSAGLREVDLTQEVGESPEQASRLERGPEERPYSPDKVREDMRGRIAQYLIGLLAFIVLATFVTLWSKGNFTEEIKDILTLILGPVVTLVGAATGYYFGGREGRR